MRQVDFSHDKLIHAITYFVKNTKSCHKVKLFKLLYFLDFEHFKETGKSVTGLDYFAWPMGPVPAALQDELAGKNTLGIRDSFRSFKDAERNGALTIAPAQAFDRRYFTKREMRIMERLAEIFCEATGQMMSDVSHLRNQPWETVYEKEGRKQEKIPYDLALDGTPESITQERLDDLRELYGGSFQ